MLLAAGLVGAPRPALAAQATSIARPESAPLPPIDGPPAPVAPATVNRDENGRATMRAFRIATPLTLDGRLDEEVYETVQGAGGFIQQVPAEGEQATEPTEIWVMYDEENLYIAARCFDSQPAREIATELRRDDSGLIQNESLSVVLDTFYDRRNGFTFQTGPLGTLRDQSIVDSQLNSSWNTVWDTRSARSDQGWTIEMVIPFKSLRYGTSGPQVWGINVRRIVKWKNENSYLSAVPAAYGQGAVNRMNAAGTLVGVETPLQSKNLELKPYVAATLATDRAATVPYSNHLAKNVGFDFKYGITRGLTADITANTDFAQVEEDLQQVNLTRFSLFFPEKREFFLEGQGIFAFGGAPLGTSSTTEREIPVIFFSRQIGLSSGQTVPVVAGARVAGQVGAYSIGALNIQTDDKPSIGATATNFSVVRLKRNVFRRSTVGMIATRRAPTIVGDDSNGAGGIDANFGFFQNVSVGGFYATTSSSVADGNNDSYRGFFEYGGDRYGLEAEHLAIGPQFNPEVGYVRRTDFRRSFGRVRFSPRTPSSRLMRKLTWQASFDYIENAGRTLVQNRSAFGSFGIEFNSGDSLAVEYRGEYEYLPRNFTIATGVVVPQGGYDYSNARFTYNIGQQRRVSGRAAITVGSFYGDGTKTEASYDGYIGLSPHFAIEPTMSLAWVDLPYGQFTARVLGARTIITPNARMVVSSLVQFNAATHSLTSSARLRWEYRPGSELFLVYSDGRDTLAPDAPRLVNRSLALKITRLLRF
ncbi:MAG: DUF5916 domain-containing protein [Vicinamibacterales bacterium]